MSTNPKSTQKKPPKLNLTVQFPDPRLKKLFPKATLKTVIQAALFAPAILTVRFVASEEGRKLNNDFRAKDYATNVLTFAYNDDIQDDMQDDNVPTQADIILCTDVLLKEAQDQQKPLEHHVQHLLIHGVLHAQGYDHEEPQEAEEMEALEIEILANLGLPNPYVD